MRGFIVAALLCAMPLGAATHIWSGAASDRISDPGNWTNGVPMGDAAADVELGPHARRDIVNDVDGLALRVVVFSGAGYTISGKPIHVRTRVDDVSGDPAGNVVAADVVIDGDVTLSSVTIKGSGLTIAGAMSGAGSVTLESRGIVTFAGASPNSYASVTRVLNGTLRLAKTPGVAAIPHALAVGALGTVDLTGRPAVVGATAIAAGGVITNGPVVLAGDVVVTGPGGVASLADVVLMETHTITSSSGGVSLGNVAGPSDAGLIFSGGANSVGTANAVTLQNRARLSGSTGALTSHGGTVGDLDVAGALQLDRASTVDGVLHVRGPIDLAGAALAFAPPSSPGKQTTVIENLGSAPVRGTFSGLAEGALTRDGRHRISYRGGATALDVVLTDVTRVVPSLSIERVTANPYALVEAGQTVKVAVTVSVATGAPAPTGEIVLRVAGEIVGRAAISGSAPVSITTSPLRVGKFDIVADYSGDAVYAPASATLPFIVWNPRPKIDSVLPSRIVAGEPTELTFAGSNFIAPVTVVMSSVHYRAKVVSPTEVRVTVVASDPQPASQVYANVYNAINYIDRYVSGPGALVTVQPPPSIGVTFHGDVVTAAATPGAMTYWLAATPDASRAGAVIQADAGGSATWNRSGLGLPFNSLVAVIDSTGAAGFVGFNDRKSASALLQTGPDGKRSRLEIDSLDTRAANVLWVRPGVGAWRIDSKTGSVTTLIYRQVAELFASDAKPLGASPPPPDAFAAGDVVAVLMNGYYTGGSSTILLRVAAQLPTPVPLLAFAALSGPVEKGSPVTYSVRRLRESGTTLAVRYTASGAPSIVPASGTLTFAPGEIEKRFVVETIDDHGNLTDAIHVQLEADDAEIDSSSKTTYAFEPDSPDPSVWIDDVRVTEGDAGTRQATLHVNVSVPAPFGFALTSSYGLVVFDPGDTHRSITVPYEANTTPEPDRTIEVTISRYYLDLNIVKGRGVVTIVDDDGPRLTIDDVVGSGTFTVALTRAAAQPVTVTWHSDHGTRSGTLTFAPGETAKTIDAGVPNVVILSDANVPFAKAVGIAKTEGSAGLAVAVADVAGGEGTTFSVPVRLNAAAAVPVTVHYTTYDGTATAADDYIAASGSVTFAPGEVEKTIAIVSLHKNVVDPDRTFFVVLDEATTTIAHAVAICTIHDVPPRRRAAGH